MLDPQSLTLARLVCEMRAQAPDDAAALRVLEDLASSYALRAAVPGAAFLDACGLSPGVQLSAPRAWAPEAAANRANCANPGNPTGAPGDAPEAAATITPAISPCEKSENFGQPVNPQMAFYSSVLKETLKAAHAAHRVVAWPKL